MKPRISTSAQRSDADDFHNPFSTRFTRPGAIEYQFMDVDEQVSLGEIANRIIAMPTSGQIVGPHGSGKSTLVQSLVPYLQSAGRIVIVVNLRDGQRRLPTVANKQKSWDANTILIVDGYEQLNGWARRCLRRRQRHQGFRLLVTTHGDMGMPLIWRTRPSEATLAGVVEQLTADLSDAMRPSKQQVHDAYHSHNGNLREALFALYDVVNHDRRELRRSLE